MCVDSCWHVFINTYFPSSPPSGCAMSGLIADGIRTDGGPRRVDAQNHWFVVGIQPGHDVWGW